VRLARALAACVALTAAAAPASAEPPRRSVVVLAATGVSLTLGDHRVVNNAPPSGELRLGWRTRHRLRVTPEAVVAGFVYPELVGAVGVGVRLNPLPATAGLRHLFVRGAVQVLAARGSDVAPGVETGAAVEGGRLIAWLGLGADRFLVHPRLVVQARLGVGVWF
jgi:hypothetical protein